MVDIIWYRKIGILFKKVYQSLKGSSMKESPALISKKDNSILIILKKLVTDIVLLFISAILFSLSFPNPIVTNGIPFIAFFALAPIIIVVHRSSWKLIFIYGAIYGYITYAMFNYWLSTFHPLAIVIVPIIYAIYFVFVFPLLKLVDDKFGKYGYWIQLLIWLTYENLRTQGFLGYPYGIIGYSQYSNTPFIQIASITGIWGVSFLVAFPSFYIGNLVKDGFNNLKTKLLNDKFLIISYLLIILLNFAFGFADMSDYSKENKWKVALIQHNSERGKDGLRTYTKNFQILKTLSLEAIKESPDIVIWSETAFVPGIDWHTKYRTDKEKYALVKDLRSFLDTQEIPYLFGSGHGQKKDPLLPPVLSDGSSNRKDYNAVILYEEDIIKQTYRKVHLVPFTENFPYKKQLPRVYQLLKDNDFHFWEKGEEFTIFNVADVNFATPICFEDVFGYISREFVKNGADIIVNLTNDSWSGSLSAQMQHLGMAVFRSIENRRSLVRSANSGMTCIIDPDGRIISMLDPLTEGYLVDEVPISTNRTTIYNRFGDWFSYLVMIILLFITSMKIIIEIAKKRKLKI